MMSALIACGLVLGLALSATPGSATIMCAGPGKGACVGGSPNGQCQTGEECDDGNTVNGDGCDNNCTVPRCGNGITTAGEECDNGINDNDVNLNATPGGNPCDTHCRLKKCGDGRLEGGEECDDGNPFNNDGCDSAPANNGSLKGNCLTVKCGNGIVDMGEACDDGNTINGDACDINCTLPGCGNGQLDPGEACDDGNTTNGDSCEGNCQLPKCGDGITDHGEACDDGNTAACDGCSATCTTEACGNHVKECTEQCDDGNTANGDACEADCTLPRCGNGITDLGESCDDGNTVSEVGGCPQNCQSACGDGITEVGEQCDGGLCVCNVFPSKFSFGRDCGSRDGASDCVADGGTCVNALLSPGGFPACSVFVNHVSDTCVPCSGATVGNSDTQPDACRDTCVKPSCGDGVTDTGEGCDDGFLGPAGPSSGDDIDTCPNGPVAFAFGLACQIANVCGDGLAKISSPTDANCVGPLCALSLPVSQPCDNGGNVILTSGGPVPAPKTCKGNPSTRCSDDQDCTDQGTTGPCGNSNSVPDACRTNCQPAHCGDGITDSNESCDDGDTLDGPLCRHNCALPSCGDGVVTPPEQCDTAASTAPGGANQPCTDTCRKAVCGDSKVCSASGCTTGPDGGPEQCDDGNVIPSDDCDNCRLNVCGDGVTRSSGTQPVEQCDDGNTASLDGCSSTCCFEPSPSIPGGLDGMFAAQQCTLDHLALDLAALTPAANSVAGARKPATVSSHALRKLVVIQSLARSATLSARAARTRRIRARIKLREQRVGRLLVNVQRLMDSAYQNSEMPYPAYAGISAERVAANGYVNLIIATMFNTP